MEISVSKNLIKIAKEFKKNDSTLYIVGGFVRNSFMKLENTDVDVCGNLPGDKVIEICTEKFGFNAFVVNKKLGTVLIKISEDEEYEYTTFRKENYKVGGSHSPESVDFITDIRIDAKRRDFTCNALYYDILKGEVVDFYGGVKDIERKQLKTIETPAFVFSSDGLRLLRLIRLNSEFGFKVEKRTLKIARAMNYQLKDISAERRLKELKQIVVADFRYENIGNRDFIKTLNDLKIYKYMFNRTLENFKIKKDKMYKKFFNLESRFRFWGFLCLILLNHMKLKNANFKQVKYTANKLFGEEGIRISNTDMEGVMSGYYIMQKLMKLTKKTNMQELAMEYSALTDKVQEFLMAFEIKNFSKLKNVINECKENNIPLNPNELKITNKELIEEVGLKNEYITKVRVALFRLAINKKIENKKSVLLEKAEFLKKKIEEDNKKIEQLKKK